MHWFDRWHQAVMRRNNHLGRRLETQSTPAEANASALPQQQVTFVAHVGLMNTTLLFWLSGLCVPSIANVRLV